MKLITLFYGRGCGTLPPINRLWFVQHIHANYEKKEKRLAIVTLAEA